MTIKGELSNDLDIFASKETTIVPGNQYRVRYRAKNEVGFGQFSDPAYIVAAGKPYQPTAVVVEIINNQVNLSWTMPYNAGSTITDAEIQIIGSDELTYHAHSDCDGSLQSIFDARECIILSTELTLSPYNLVQASHIYA